MKWLRSLLCTPDSPIFKAIAWFLESQLWFRFAAAAALVVLPILLGSVLTNENQEDAFALSVVSCGCALTNVVAYSSYRPQVVALIGHHGLHPAEEVLRRCRRSRFARAPCLLRLLPTGHLTDRTLLRCCDLGIACGVGLMVLVWPSTSCWQLLVPFLWIAAGWTYLSLQAVSGDFLGLQSDSNLVEVDALMALVSILARSHPRQALVAVRFFAFRKMLGCGVCKYYGSPMWRSFDALGVHYFTQPLVNFRSCWAHNLPPEFHRFSVLATFVVEVILPFFIWGPWPFRIFAWIGFNSLNAMINTTGNYGFIGFLNTRENLSLVDDRFWSLLGIDVNGWRQPKTTVLPIRLVVVLMLVLYVLLSLLPLARAGKGSVDVSSATRLPKSVVERFETLEAMQQPWKLVNYQGKFSAMHDFRWEPILEASVDGGNSWRQLRWRYKLNQGAHECGQVLWLHLPRLDWRVWFLPLGARRGKDPPAWYMRLLERLAECDETVMQLLDGCPFTSEEFQDPTHPKMWVSSRLVACEVCPKDDTARWSFRDIRKQTTMDLLVKDGGVCESAKRRRLDRTA